MKFERIDGREVWSGRTVSVRIDRLRYDNGQEEEREVVHHDEVVAMAAVEDGSVYLVAQPREVVDEQALVELPAGKIDVEGEGQLETAKRELAEEIGKGARSWTHLKTFYSSPGFTDERVHLYLATDLYDERAEASDTARIEVLQVPLAELDRVIANCRDAKSLVGLLWLRTYGDRLPLNG